MLPTSYPNNYLLNSLDIGINGKLGYTSQKSITANNELVHKKYVDDANALKLNLTGGSMSGAIDMTNQKITSTYVPVNGPDLTNKTYVDSVIPNLTNYSTTAQIKAFNDMTNYYTKTYTDANFRGKLEDITALNNGTQDNL